jgi:hypothetical protein
LLFILYSVSAFACRVDLRATIPLTQAGGLLLIPVTLNGVTVDFVLDTGAERTVVALQPADSLGIARDEWISTDMQGTGGWDRRRLGRPRTLSLGGIALRRHTVAQDNSVVIGPVPDVVAGHKVAGLLGQDYLSLFDLDLDAAAGVVKLYGVSGCSGSFLPWPGHPVAMAASRPVRNILVLPVRVAGQSLAAELDTGASRTVIMAPGMVRLGLAPGGPDHERGFGTGSVAAREQSFTMQVGSLKPGETSLVISQIHALRSVDMLLGADWAMARRLWISWATNQVFVPG